MVGHNILRSTSLLRRTLLVVITSLRPRVSRRRQGTKGNRRRMLLNTEHRSRSRTRHRQRHNMQCSPLGATQDHRLRPVESHHGSRRGPQCRALNHHYTGHSSHLRPNTASPHHSLHGAHNMADHRSHHLQVGHNKVHGRVLPLQGNSSRLIFTWECGMTGDMLCMILEIPEILGILGEIQGQTQEVTCGEILGQTCGEILGQKCGEIPGQT